MYRCRLPSLLGLSVFVFICLLVVSPRAQANEVRIAVSKSPLSLPFFVAKEKDLFAKHNVKTALIECLGGNKCMKELNEGRVDMATASELPFMFAAFDLKPINLIATFVTNKDDMKFVVRKSVIKGGVSSLLGKRVGFVERASSHYYMDLVLLYHGIDPRSVVPVPMGAGALAGALNNGEVDAISVWEPWGQVALDMGGDTLEVLHVPKLYSQTFNLMVSNEFRQIQPRQISAILLALDEAIRFIKSNPEDAKRIMARDAGIDQRTVSASWNTHQFELSLQQSFLTTVQGQARWAMREGHVGEKVGEPEFFNFIDPSFLRKHRPSSVDFVYP